MCLALLLTAMDERIFLYIQVNEPQDLVPTLAVQICYGEWVKHVECRRCKSR